MPTVKPFHTSLHVDFLFDRPILNWTNVPGRFFETIYNSQTTAIPVLASEFQVVNTTSYSDLAATYRLFGGASSISLSAEKLSFDFPGLKPNEHSLAKERIGSLHDVWLEAFPEATYKHVDVQNMGHLHILDECTPADYFARFLLVDAPRVFEDSPVVVFPSAKFEVLSEDQTWRCRIVVERSLASSEAVFVAFTASLLNVDPGLPFADKANVVSELQRKMFLAVGLELENDSAT